MNKERELAREQALLYQYYLYESTQEEEEIRHSNSSSLDKLNELRSKLTANTEQLKAMEEQRKKVNEEYEAINKELQHCKDEYDAYERKDIQYHENMKAQKANLKRLRGKCKTNEEEKETKEKSVVTMEANLKRCCCCDGEERETGRGIVSSINEV